MYVLVSADMLNQLVLWYICIHVCGKDIHKNFLNCTHVHVSCVKCMVNYKMYIYNILYLYGMCDVDTIFVAPFTNKCSSDLFRLFVYRQFLAARTCTLYILELSIYDNRTSWGRYGWRFK